MTSDGRGLEELAAFVEETLVTQGFRVRTNKRVYTEEGTQAAEFDIEIEGKVGSTPIRWLIECRDRPACGAAPAAWIEQLAGRRDRFQFNKVTAVSSTGFTAEAKRYAGQIGIELREVAEVSPDEFKDWLQLSSMTFAVRLHNLQHARVFVDPAETQQRKEAVLNFLNSIKGTTAFLRSSSTDKIRPLNRHFSVPCTYALKLGKEFARTHNRGQLGFIVFMITTQITL